MWNYLYKYTKSVEVEYRDLITSEPSELIRILAGMQNISAYNVVLKGDSLKGRKFSIIEHHIKNGSDKEIIACTGEIGDKDSLNINFYAYPSQNCIKLHFSCNASKVDFIPSAISVRMHNSEFVWLMETYIDEELTIDKPIPIISLNSGVYTEREFLGTTITGHDQKPLIKERIHPSIWTKRFKMDDYIYFEVKFD